MPTYQITSDSTVDLSPARMQELGVPFVSLHLLLDGQDILDDMKETSALSLYNAMRAGKIGTTSQATVESFLELWEPMLQSGQDILYVGFFSSGLSGTATVRSSRASSFLNGTPSAASALIDSLCASTGEGMLLEHAVALRESGLSLDDCHKAVEALKLRVHHWFTVDDLVYLKRGGRVSGAAATIATLCTSSPL
jgi:DegV family protein with EDD domain